MTGWWFDPQKPSLGLAHGWLVDITIFSWLISHSHLEIWAIYGDIFWLDFDFGIFWGMMLFSEIIWNRSYPYAISLGFINRSDQNWGWLLGGEVIRFPRDGHQQKLTSCIWKMLTPKNSRLRTYPVIKHVIFFVNRKLLGKYLGMGQNLVPLLFTSK